MSILELLQIKGLAQFGSDQGLGNVSSNVGLVYLFSSSTQCSNYIKEEEHSEVAFSVFKED